MGIAYIVIGLVVGITFSTTIFRSSFYEDSKSNSNPDSFDLFCLAITAVLTGLIWPVILGVAVIAVVIGWIIKFINRLNK